MHMAHPYSTVVYNVTAASFEFVGCMQQTVYHVESMPTSDPA